LAGGYVGKIGFINLSNGEIREQELDETLARHFIGGHGLGVRVLYEKQKGRVDPLGPENILGFVTGSLTGTPVPTGGRYTVVCKSRYFIICAGSQRINWGKTPHRPSPTIINPTKGNTPRIISPIVNPSSGDAAPRR